MPCQLERLHRDRGTTSSNSTDPAPTRDPVMQLGGPLRCSTDVLLRCGTVQMCPTPSRNGVELLPSAATSSPRCCSSPLRAKGSVRTPRARKAHIQIHGFGVAVIFPSPIWPHACDEWETRSKDASLPPNGTDARRATRIWVCARANTAMRAMRQHGKKDEALKSRMCPTNFMLVTTAAAVGAARGGPSPPWTRRAGGAATPGKGTSQRARTQPRRR